MKKLLSYILVFLITLSFVFTDTSSTVYGAKDWPKGPEVFAETAVLLDASTGAVLYDKKCHQKMYPASITKIMTALLSIENCNLNDKVTFSENAVNGLNYFEDANIGCQVGEEMTVKDCLYGLMLSSANEVATALGEHVAGDTAKFADMMNERAKQAGATDTHFANANGLHDKNHYVTAYDMAMITRAAAAHDVFNQIVNTVSYTIPKNNKRKKTFSAQQRHKMVSPYNSVYYEGIIGGKTGYTDQAGTTLVTYAQRNGMTLISVVLHSNGENVYKDTTALLDYGFKNFEQINAASNLGSVSDNDALLPSPFNNMLTTLEFDPNATVIVPKGVTFADLASTVSFQQTEESFASINYTYLDHPIGSVAVKYVNKKAEDVKTTNDKTSTVEQTTAAKQSPAKSFKIPKIMVPLLCVAFVIVILLILIIQQKKKMNRIRASKRQRNR
ncbi:MAG: D-alanyl-D-alanine carboxypeptidase [Eubacterium sp.]|nr:D-alanyl-D-alanine carboxypeptidase [Eubacterium sp.]